MRCNLTEAEQKAALEVPFRCTGEEQEFIERCFIGYLFFEHEADENGRLGVTTECTRCGRKVWWTEREWKRFKQENDVKARSNLLCPDCGCGVTLYPRGRLRNGNALDEYRQVVLLRAIDGALRAVALSVWKHHGRWESVEVTEPDFTKNAAPEPRTVTVEELRALLEDACRDGLGECAVLVEGTAFADLWLDVHSTLRIYESGERTVELKGTAKSA